MSIELNTEEMQKRRQQWKPKQEKAREPQMNSGVIDMIGKVSIESNLSCIYFQKKNCNYLSSGRARRG